MPQDSAHYYNEANILDGVVLDPDRPGLQELWRGFRATVNQTADFAFKTHLAEVWSGRFVRVQQCGDAFGCVGYGG